ncbi:hypothetical protein FKP32DRAFT_1543094, partial [Trametes sanguinea]
MRIDGSTCAVTHVEEETGSVILRRLHPRIASYNDLTMFLMQCNMDVKFIGSGEAAKALLYYVTDYITKPSLPVHVGLGALSYAIQKANEKFPGASTDAAPRETRGALTLTVNRMMSRQEISHQQVMSYLVGGGDVYCSHTFRVLYWGAFDRLFKSAFARDSEIVGGEEHPGEEESSYVLKLDHSGSISASNQEQDYIYRPIDPVFAGMPLYDFVGLVEKLKRPTTGGASANDDQDTSQSRRRGRTMEARGLFSSSRHTQYETHMLRKRTLWTVPVVLGDRTPRSDRGQAEKEVWARMMSILFIPWRKPSDLRNESESWDDAFERQKHQLSDRHAEIIANMNVLSECKDVRDSFSQLRRSEALAVMHDGLPMSVGHQHSGQDAFDVDAGFELFDRPNDVDMYEHVHELAVSQTALDNSVGARTRELLDVCFSGGPQIEHERTRIFISRHREEEDDAAILRQSALMRTLRKKRRPDFLDEDDNPRPRRRARNAEVIENVSHANLTSSARVEESECFGADDVDPILSIVNRIVEEMGLDQNAEQERAFRLAAEHIRTGDGQLMMYIAGVGGTGKTHVVHSIVTLLKRLGR